MNENLAKAIVLESLLPELRSGSIVVSELTFNEGQARADLAVVGAGEFQAIEIKTASDDLRKLSQQIDRYRQMFLSVCVYCSAPHINNARKLLPERVGLGVFGSHGAYLIRKPKTKRRLIKSVSSDWLNTVDCQRLLREHGVSPHGDIAELRQKSAGNLSTKELTTYAIESVRLRYLERWNRFLTFKGRHIIGEDIKNMTGGGLVSH